MRVLHAHDEGYHPFSVSKVRRIIQEMGWRPAILGTLPFVLKIARSWWWDRSHHVETRRRIPVSQLGIVGPGAEHAKAYEASDTKCFSEILGKLNIAYSNFLFIDLGAGKGKTLIMASQFPFKRILGVELSPSLSRVARRNCNAFLNEKPACATFEIMCANAAEIAFPDDPLVIYMFNPFDESILSRVLANLKQSLSQQPREVFVVYYNPLHDHAIKASGAFEFVFEGTDGWDYRKLQFSVFRARADAFVRHQQLEIGSQAKLYRNPDFGISEATVVPE